MIRPFQNTISHVPPVAAFGVMLLMDTPLWILVEQFEELAGCSAQICDPELNALCEKDDLLLLIVERLAAREEIVEIELARQIFGNSVVIVGLVTRQARHYSLTTGDQAQHVHHRLDRTDENLVLPCFDGPCIPGDVRLSLACETGCHATVHGTDFNATGDGPFRCVASLSIPFQICLSTDK